VQGPRHDPVRSDSGPPNRPQIGLLDAARGSSALRLLLLVGLAASLGTYALSTTEGWLVLQITGTATSVGVVTFLATLPWLFLSIRAGAIADRYGPSSVLTAAQGIAATSGLVLAMLIVLGRVAYWEVLGVAFVSGVTNVLTSAAYLSMLTGYASGGNVEAATGLNNVMGSVARIVGPFSAGALILRLGTGITCLVSAVCLFASTCTALLLHSRHIPSRRSFDSGLTQPRQPGIVVSLTRRVRTVLLASWVLSISVTPAINIIPVLARDSGLGPIGLAAFTASVGIGGAMAVVAYSRVPISSRRRSTIGALAVVPVMLVLIGVVPGLISVLAFAVLGSSQAILSVYTISVIAEDIVETQRGRVLGLYLVAANGLSPFGNILAGISADITNSPTTYEVLGFACLGLLLLVGWSSGERRTAAR
jgi:predicted MFS family arabinose efflux permease